MIGFLQPVLVLLWKDILLEIRSKDLVISVLVFGLLVVIIFNFALNASTRQTAGLAPGILWVAYAFAGTLAMNRAFMREKEQGGLEGLLLTPVSRDAIFLGKAMASFFFMLLVEAVLLPVFAALLGFSALSWILAATIFLATFGFAMVGTLFSAIAVQTRSRELMLPVLFFPVILPVIIGAVQLTTLAVGGETGVGLDRWLPLLVIFDALFLVICPWVFSAVMEE
jgi:heme exporter protein B